MIELLCTLPKLDPKVALLCGLLGGIVDAICEIDGMILDYSCSQEAEDRPHSPLGLDDSLVNSAVEAIVRVRTCEGFEARRSGLVQLAGSQAEAELTVDGCTGTGEGARSSLLASMGHVAIVGGSGTYRVFETFEDGDVRSTEGSGSVSVSVRSPDRVLAECAAYSWETGEVLARFRTVAGGFLRARAEPEGGYLELEGSVDRQFERVRQPTPQEEPGYELQVDECVAPAQYEVGNGTIFAFVQLLPLQRLRITITSKGGVSGLAALASAAVEEVPLVPGGEIVLETTYEEIADGILSGSDLGPSDLPEGEELPDGTRGPLCHLAVLQIDATVSVLHDAAGVMAFSGRLDYRIEILDN